VKERKKEIIEKAAELFREKGYAACGVRDIASAVGLEPSSLYSHINSKEDLLFEICMECASHYNRAINELITSHTSINVELLKEIITIHIDFALNDPTSSTVFSDEWKHMPEEKRNLFIMEKKAYEKKFIFVLDQLIIQKFIPAYNTHVLMNTLISATRWLHYVKRNFSEKEKLEMREEILRLIMP
jgi:TetR/AcrR family transcriptional regulator, cholesterol catabolism regulator